MNAWNQWGAAAAYPTPLPGYATPQAAAGPAIPGAAAGLPPVAAAAAVPYPAMPGFQAWPYAPAPQTMTPWAAATAGAANPAGQAAQWDQWNQWHQQYSQWQQQYAAQTAVTTALSQQLNSTTVATPKVSMVPQVQTVAASTAPTLATNTTTTAATVSNVKRPNDVAAEAQPETKKSKIEQSAWSQTTPSSTTSKELEELSEAEKQFDEQFKSWEAQFDAWRQQNASHPDTDQYKAYEAKWASWREQLLTRREQMKKKREKLTEAAASTPSVSSVKPVVETADTVVNTVTTVPSAALPPMYSGYAAAGITSTAPSVPQYASHYQQPQTQFMSAYLNPAVLPQATVAPPQISSQPPTVASTGGSDESASQQREFLKTSTSNGIPGLDLLSGSTAHGDTKTVPSVSFANSTQLPFQTPADNKPFDFPPPRQSQGFPGQNQAVGQASALASQQQQPGASAAGLPGGYPPGIIPPASMHPPGFPPTFNNQPGGGFQGAAQSAGYQGIFPGQNPSGGYQSQAPPTSGFPPSGPTPYQGPPTSGFQATQAPPTSTFQAQPPSTGYQQTSGYGQPPPPTGFPSMGGYGMPPGAYPMAGFPQQSQDSPQQSFPNQQGPPGNFQDPSKSGNYPYQSQQNRPQFPPTSSAQDQSKKLPGLMDNVLSSDFSDRPQTADGGRGDNFPRSGRTDENFPNKFPDRFGDPGKDKFGDKPVGGPGMGPRFGDTQFSGKDGSHSYSLPKPKGYFNLQEMSEEEEYEKFHEYQQAIEKDDQDDDDHSRRPRPGDDSRNSRYDRPSRFEDSGSRFDDSGSRPRFDESRSRFEDNKLKFDGTRPSRFDGARPSRFEDASPNRFPPHSQPPPDKDKFKRSFENELSGPPPSMGGNMPLQSPSKPLRSTRWGASEPEVEPEPPRSIGVERRFGGGLGPPFGATPDGLDFLFSVIIDYNHSPANLGVPDYFEPMSVIDYTHGLNGIKVEESKDDWERKQRGAGRGPSPAQPWDRDRDRGNYGERRSPWKDDRSGDRSGQYGSHGGSRGGPDLSRGGPDMSRSGSEGSRGGHDKSRDGPRSGSEVSRGDSEGPRGGQDDRSRPDRPRDSYRGGSDSQRDDRSRDRGGGGGASSRWGDLDDRDRRRRDSSSDKRSRSPDRNRHSDRMADRRDDRRGDRKDSERDRRKRSRSPVVETRAEPPPPVVCPPAIEREVVPVDDILQPPGRESRPSKIALFLRGPPGSGKSFLAKMIKDKEVKFGGTAPRILSLDDYFMSDIEKEEVDLDSGRTIKKKVMEYEFEGAMEQKYRDSLNKCFRKTVTDGYFPFIIVDANNDKICYFDSMINFCQIRGFTCYIIDMEQDLNQCIKRNIHKRTEKDIQTIIKGYEPTPPVFKSLDVRSLLQEASIPEVDMEDSMDTVQSDETPDKPEIVEGNKTETPADDKNKPLVPPADSKSEDNEKEVKAAERTTVSTASPLLANPVPPSRTGFRFQNQRPPLFQTAPAWAQRRGYGGPMWRNAPNRRR